MEPESAPEPAADHADSLADVGRGTRDDFHEADSFRRRAMQNDVALEAEESDGDRPGSLAHDRWAQRRHSYRSRRRYYQSRESVSIPQPGWIHRGELEQLVIEAHEAPI